MAEQKELPIAEPDEPVLPGQSQTANAVAVARLLHHECTRLLQLYKERETVLADHTPEPGRLVSPSQSQQEPSAEEQVQQLHSALRQCLGLLHRLIVKEEEEWGELEGDYATMRKTVQHRLENLLTTTKALAETKDVILEVTPDIQCNEEVDGAEGAFGLKLWTFRVLLELIHWADHAAQALHVLHKAREEPKEK